MRPKQITIFVALVIVTLFLILLNVKGGLKPVKSTVAQASRPFVYIFSGIGNSVKSFFSYFGSVRKLSRDNADLVALVHKLQQENIDLQQYKLENETLKKELNYRGVTNFNLVSATVIASDPTGFSQTITINIGDNEGIKVGSAVLAEGVLIGKIIAVDLFTAKALLVTDPQSLVQAQISGTTDTGIVRGSFGSGIVLDTISQSVQISPGEQVVSSGSGTDIPRGILIGTIGQILSQKNDLLQKASVISSVDLKNLSFVSVIKQ